MLRSAVNYEDNFELRVWTVRDEVYGWIIPVHVFACASITSSHGLLGLTHANHPLRRDVYIHMPTLNNSSNSMLFQFEQATGSVFPVAIRLLSLRSESTIFWSPTLAHPTMSRVLMLLVISHSDGACWRNNPTPKSNPIMYRRTSSSVLTCFWFHGNRLILTLFHAKCIPQAEQICWINFQSTQDATLV